MLSSLLIAFVVSSPPVFRVPVRQQERPGVLERFTPSIDEEACTQVLVLGTPHLSQVQGFERVMLESLLEVLEDWAPDVICVETLPGRTVAAMLAEEEVFEPALVQFVGDMPRYGHQAQEYLQVDRAEAAARLRAPQPELSSFELALLALAAFELPTALLQWDAWRADGDPVPEELERRLVTFLDQSVAASGEVTSLALPLARRLGLERLDAVDDHLDKDDYMSIATGLLEDLAGSKELDEAASAPVFRASADSLVAAVAERDLLPHYVHMNAAAYGTADVSAQWDVFLRTRLDSGLDRARLALWDVRNLGIGANIRRAAARVPGGRVLVIIGAGHKPFIDALLDTMLDVRVVHLAGLVNPTEDAHPAGASRAR